MASKRAMTREWNVFRKASRHVHYNLGRIGSGICVSRFVNYGIPIYTAAVGNVLLGV
jgi:hypothetical protein